MSYDVNWSLCGSGVPPQHELLYNANDRDLMQHSQGKVDAEKALHASLESITLEIIHSCGFESASCTPMGPYDAEDLMLQVGWT